MGVTISNNPNHLPSLWELPETRSLVGGKAAQLAALIRAKLPVPDGFCLTTDIFFQAVKHNGLEQQLQRIEDLLPEPARSEELRQASLQLTQALKNASLPPELSSALQRRWTKFRNSTVSVRSSAVQEDHEGASFAGLFDTVLGVSSFDALLSAIKGCWASLFSEQALTYYQKKGIKGDRIAMAVVVQRMLQPSSSGVLFTVNPINGSRREMVLDAGWGLGDAYVSGQASADNFLLSRPYKPNAKATLKILHKVIVPKARMLVNRRGSKPRWQDVPRGRQDTPTLSEEDAQRVGRLGLAAERLFGSPRDVEWAMEPDGSLYLLQARPITTAPSASAHRRRSDVLWTNRFSGERWTHGASPMGWSIIAPILNHFVHFEDASKAYLKDSLPVRLYRGNPYFNITIFRHLLFKLPGSPPPQFILEFFPKEEQEEILHAPYILPNIGLVTAIFKQVFKEKRWERFAWKPMTNYKVWAEFLPRFENAISELPSAGKDSPSARKAAARCRDLIIEYLSIHVTSLAFASIFYQVLDILMRRWAQEADPHLLSALITHASGNKTVETNLALWELAKVARRYPDIHARFMATAELPSLEDLRGLQGGEEFDLAFASFIEKFGHRSSASWEMFSPRWNDTPQLPLGMVRNYLSAGLRQNPEGVDAASESSRRLAERQIIEGIKKHAPPGRRTFRLKTFRLVLETARYYSLLRENQRFYFDRLLLKCKRVLENLGSHLHNDNKLPSAADIVLLTLEEVDDLLSGHLDSDEVKALTQYRRKAMKSQGDKHLPTFLKGESHYTEPYSSNKSTLIGLGISPGRITGKVRVINDLNEGIKLSQGDILVTRATDPGWTPLFLTAGGLILELGSLLSHGAVVAREYNLPAVVNISDATQRLKDGQIITLDGNRGIIYLH